jgi:hypothetical protein
MEVSLQLDVQAALSPSILCHCVEGYVGPTTGLVAKEKRKTVPLPQIKTLTVQP